MTVVVSFLWVVVAGASLAFLPKNVFPSTHSTNRQTQWRVLIREGWLPSLIFVFAVFVFASAAQRNGYTNDLAISIFVIIMFTVGRIIGEAFVSARNPTH